MRGAVVDQSDREASGDRARHRCQGVGRGVAAAVRAAAGGVAFRCLRAAGAGAVEGLPIDAGDGDRGAGRLGRVAVVVPETGRGLRSEYAPRDPADRLEYRPGDQAQCDLWFPPVKIPLGPGQVRDATGVGDRLVVLAVDHRDDAAVADHRRSAAGMWELMSGQLGAVPRRLIWDNEAGIGRRNRYAEGVAGFCGTLATRIVQLRPFDPESKGIVERANGYPGDLVPARADVRLARRTSTSS